MEWKDLSPREEEIINELSSVQEELSSKDLSRRVKMSRAQVCSTIKSIRHKFLMQKNVPYVYRNRFGFTLNEDPVFESKMRMQTGFSHLVNGIHVFKMHKRLKIREFQKMTLSFQPKAVEVRRLLLK